MTCCTPLDLESPLRDKLTKYEAGQTTFWLVLGACGSAILAAAFPGIGIGLLAVSFAFGLTVLTMAYAIGHISGCPYTDACFPGRDSLLTRPAAIR